LPLCVFFGLLAAGRAPALLPALLDAALVVALARFFGDDAGAAATALL
jgi:hypothetical protein